MPAALAGRPVENDVKALVPFQPVGSHDQDADDRSQPCGEYRTEDSHAAGKNKHIVQNNIGEAAGDGGGHGQLGISIVADEAQQYIVEDKGRGKQQQHLQVGIGHIKHRRVSSEKPCQSAGEKKSRQYKKYGKDQGQVQGDGIHPVRLPVRVLAF